ncbi:MAG: HAMP domain-containing sensor histidine kinase [Kineosporiaceae bacterium]
MPRTLRAQLVLVLATLTAGIAVLMGAASLIALERNLTGQLRQQLDATTSRSRPAMSDPSGHDGDPDSDDRQDDDGPAFLDLRGQAEGTLGVLVQGDRIVERGVIGSTWTPTAAQQAMLAAVPQDGAPHRLELGGALGHYLVQVVPTGGNSRAVIGLPYSGIEHTVAELARVVALVALLAVASAVLAGLVLVRLALRPLRRVATTASRVAELPLERGDVTLHERVPDRDTDPRTEVGQVGTAINRMLGHIDGALAVRTASEARMRRFVADASHELRTPLASIRGYAELTRRQGGDLPEQVLHAVGRVESEAVRMTGLVEDLLLLARLDESPQAAAIRHEPVDLTAVAIDCTNDAHLLAPGHHWQLELPDEPVMARGDAARLLQVLTNLLANARVHTPAGTRVTVRLHEQDGEVTLEVHDDGPGIPAALQPAAFDRFARADSSRSRAAGSTGLGLAIVASVVQAHGGRVDLDSRPGATTFRVVLPSATPPG